MPARRVSVLAGSLRRDAFSRRVATALKLLQPPTLNLEIVEIAALPFYNPDLEAETPFPWVEFRDKIRASDAVLFVTP
jgi:chromate reductase